MLLAEQQPALLWRVSQRWWELPGLLMGMYMAAGETLFYRGMLMFGAGLTPNARERREYQRMIQEKMDALVESSLGVSADLAGLASDFARMLWTPWPLGTDVTLWRLYQEGMRRGSGHSLHVADALGSATVRGLQPWRRRVHANAKRLRARQR